MEEDSGVKAPVTRLRRRLSTEVDGTQSPLTPSTPTKKRNTRIAKPALELIDENISTPVKETAPKRGTLKVSAKDEDVVEPPLTPSRRSTRIRSNTSLVLETAQYTVTDSPRARRAARRASHLESDTESSTPARQTRRTRKDSTSSVEKLAVTNSNDKAVAPVAEAISEEPEKEIKNDTSNNPTPTRKSPRLKGKKTVDELDKDLTKTPKQNANKTTKKPDEVSSSTNELTSVDENEKKNEFKPQDVNLSQDSAKLINEIDSNPVKSKHGNKTICTTEELTNDKGKIKRTKSWTSITSGDTPAEKFDINKLTSSDAVINKADIKDSTVIYTSSMGNKEHFEITKAAAQDAEDIVKILEKTPVKNLQTIILIDDSDSNSDSVKLPKDMHYDIPKTDMDDQCVPVVKDVSPKKSASDSFVVEPMDIDETIPGNVTINDFSDKSNASENENSNDKSLVKNKSSNNSRTSINLQQELNSSKQKSSSISEDNINKCNDSIIVNKSQRKSSISLQNESRKINNESNSKCNSSLSRIETDNTDKRKSSVSSQVSDKLNESSNKLNRKSISETQNTSTNENKSTLVLSQLKDVSANEINRSRLDSNKSLSKSDNALVKGTDKKNPSLDSYLTSTPLQQKSLQKIAMQINTSIISPSTEIKNTSKVNKTKTPVKNASTAESDSDLSSDESRDKSKIIDDEAEEASDNYESGDSRDDAEKQYEKDNAIPDRGETLESEQNFSDDSNYEKDSFVVSSDEEDKDLLSGSGDDLSLSDNELKMTSKSKKKFDARKRKEQKKASKEMYEARHQLNESDKSSKTKYDKWNSKTLDTSDSDSEEDCQPKKKIRQRIDSSKDYDDINVSLSVKKKKTKQLSESVCDDDAAEMEITLNNQSGTEKKDPLVAAIKQEPKTPQKDLNLSVALIKDNIEEVQVDTNTSVFKLNETTDPLQATTAQDDEESDSDMSNLSLFSLENKQITNDYDSILENLNKANSKQNEIKKRDTSLNLNKNNKKKDKEPIVDQLNLTQTKKSKKNKAQTQNDTEKSIEKPKTNNEISVLVEKDTVDGYNSDSIDMRLLFSDDSNESVVNKSNINNQGNNQDPAEKVISLKKSTAKTNLRDNLDELEENVAFFIDTKGDFEEMDTSTQNSAKKKKKNRTSLCEINGPEIKNTSGFEENSINVLLKSDKKKKNKSLLDRSQATDDMGPEEIQMNTSVNTEHKKKKNKSLLDVSQVTDNIAPEVTPVNVSLNSDKKKKKNKSQLNISEVLQDAEAAEEPANVSISSENKKKKNKSFLDGSQITATEVSEAPTNISMGSEKKKKKNKSTVGEISTVETNEYAAVEETSNNVSLNSEKKKKKSKTSLSEYTEGTAVEETPINVSLNSEKKKKKSKTSLSENTEETAVEETPINVSFNKENKKKKNKSICEDTEEAVEVMPVNVSLNKENKKKKNKTSLSEDIEGEVVEETPINVSLNSEKKKRKKNKSTSEMSEDGVAEESPANVSSSSDKKYNNKTKLDVSNNDKKTNNAKEWLSTRNNENADDDSDDAPEEVKTYKTVKKSDMPEPVEDELNKSKNKFKKKKRKKASQTEVENADGDVKAKKRTHDEVTVTDTISGVFQMSKNKKKRFTEDDAECNGGANNPAIKRKATEEAAVQKKNKAFKGNFFEKIHVPRLPDSIVSQLEDQPNLTKKQKHLQAISTMPFMVEEGPRRKNKPSNYLEQSVYLNDSISPQKKKQKSSKKVPKVLPFTPTAITSEEGYTSNFKINVLPKQTEFLAGASNVANFKERLLSKQRLNKLKVERYKRVNTYMKKF